MMDSPFFAFQRNCFLSPNFTLDCSIIPLEFSSRQVAIVTNADIGSLYRFANHNDQQRHHHRKKMVPPKGEQETMNEQLGSTATSYTTASKTTQSSRPLSFSQLVPKIWQQSRPTANGYKNSIRYG